jgi:predicted nucleotidyltransferase
MKIRPRYFIETKDNLLFAVNSYYHPESYIVSFLRYVPAEDGDRVRNGITYKKVNSKEAYGYLNDKHPNYLFDWNIKDKKTMGVPITDIKNVYDPTEFLKEIMKNNNTSYFQDMIKSLALTFKAECGIPLSSMGVTGSSIVGLQKDETSDIDFIIFGLKNNKLARDTFGKLKNDPSSDLNAITDDYWKRIYKKRIKDNSLSFEEFKWYESRKNNRGLFKNRLFDILCTMDYSEIPFQSNLYYEPIGKMKIKCKILDDSKSFDTPAIYNVCNVKILEGHAVTIKEVVSFTHTYAGEVQNKEEVLVNGVCEKVTNKDNGKVKYILVVGTTRESIGEYIKLEKMDYTK